MKQVMIFDGIRTPFGRHAGALAAVRPDDLLGAVLKALVERNEIDSRLIEDVIAGCSIQAGEDCRNVARNASLLGGLDTCVAGITVNRLCGSGAAAALDASRAIRTDEGDLFIAAGVESMSRAPWVMNKAETPYGRAQEIFDCTLGWRFPNQKLLRAYGDDSMPQTADNIAAAHHISREDSDEFAYHSQQKYAAAKAAGFFTDEILAIEVAAKKPQAAPTLVNADEHPRPETALEKLHSLASLFAGGVVTAGNASGINDGAAGLLIGSDALANKLGIKPRGRILAGAVAGVQPGVMGLGPVPACQKALQRAGLSLADMDVIEINEAFATQVLGCLKLLDIDFKDERVNPNGGAITIGHPLGASGARLILTALRQLERTEKQYGLVSMCIGIGQGIAVLIERVE